MDGYVSKSAQSSEWRRVETSPSWRTTGDCERWVSATPKSYLPSPGVGLKGKKACTSFEVTFVSTSKAIMILFLKCIMPLPSLGWSTKDNFPLLLPAKGQGVEICALGHKFYVPTYLMAEVTSKLVHTWLNFQANIRAS